MIILMFCQASVIAQVKNELSSLAVNNNIEKWLVLRGSSLVVNGSTNINKFSCRIPEYINNDTLYFYRNSLKNESCILKGNLILQVTDFDCHNAMMSSDLCKTLQAKKYPALIIQFLSINTIPDVKSGKGWIKGDVSIEMAGVKKVFEVNYQYAFITPTLLYMIGTRPVNFSDFNLEPPRKLGGMIRTNEKLDVAFTLKMELMH
ncbi:YceI family protein [Hydrotalea flava]|uniref:YceI family protein n=1 Tax=Hydrotalea flava TaxID=714549 RepID=UPI00142F2225|nr:YceI family protein [Hydrotalea flava]